MGGRQNEQGQKSPKINQRQVTELCRAFLTLKTPKEVQIFLADLLSHEELIDLPKRWAIAQDLNRGKTQRAVIEKYKCGAITATRANAALRRGVGGFRLALDRLNKSNKNKSKKSRPEV